MGRGSVDTAFVLFIVLGVLIFGSLVAVWWWRLARQIAPYKDEVEKEQAGKAKQRSEQEVVIVPPTGLGASKTKGDGGPRSV
jgi:type VI protein secretion system component VasK